MGGGHIFVSYSSHDRDVADLVCAQLESQGRAVWIAPRNVPPGMSYPQAIVTAIRECDVGLLVLSEQSNSSPHVLREVERMSADAKPLFVLRVEAVSLSDGLSYFASLLQWVDAPKDRLLRDPAEVLRPITEAGYPFKEHSSGASQSVGLENPATVPAVPSTGEISLSALADAQRRLLTTFGVAVLDYICQQPDPSKPIPRRELLTRLTEAAPNVFDGVSPRQFETLLTDARSRGCAPGLSESADGLFVVEENIAVKRERNQVAKALIARYAAAFVKPGMTVAVDGGSTTLPIVEIILAAVEAGDLEDVAIVTNSLTSAAAISQFMSAQGWTDESALVSLNLVGGIVRPNTHATTWGAFVEREAEELLGSLGLGSRPIDVGFVGGNGFGADTGITMGSSDELGFKRFVIEHSKAPFVVADSSKAGITLPVSICSWNDDFTLLTNVLTPDALLTLDELVLSGKIVEVRE